MDYLRTYIYWKKTPANSHFFSDTSIISDPDQHSFQVDKYFGFQEEKPTLCLCQVMARALGAAKYVLL